MLDEAKPLLAQAFDVLLCQQYIEAIACGRSRESRESSVVAAVSRAFIDESGNEDTEAFVLGGLAGHIDMWLKFTEKWLRVLAEYEVKNGIHMFKLAGGDGYTHLTIEEQLELCLELVGVVDEFKPQPFIYEIGGKDYRDYILPTLPPRNRVRTQAQFAAYQYGIAAVGLSHAMLRLEDFSSIQLGTLDIIFDWHEKFGPQVKRFTDNALPYMVRHNMEPKHLDRLGVSIWPRPEQRHNYIPLQAADFIVWHQRRHRAASKHNYKQSYDHRPVYDALRAAVPWKFSGINTEDAQRNSALGLYADMVADIERMDI